MRTIAIINQKGGCGKTTTSINLAACLARLGQKTLLVDVDPQGHCAVGLAVPEEQIERTIFDCLLEDRDGKPAKVADIVWQIATDFDLAPSNIKLAAFEQMFSGRIGREDRLRKALEPVKQNYKWCIVDCPPSVGLITFNALRACDEAIVPVETGYFSLHGLAKMMETLELLRDRCDKEILIRVLPTLYDTRTKLAREVLSELRNKFREYLMESTVNFNTKLKEAASFGQPITEYDPGSRGYKDFVNLARELMGHIPMDVEPTPMDKLSRPAELVQRAKQLAQLTNLQFGRNAVPAAPPAPATVESTPIVQPNRIDTPVLEPIAATPVIAERPMVSDRPVISDRPIISERPAVRPTPVEPTPAMVPAGNGGSIALSLTRGNLHLGSRMAEEPEPQPVLIAQASPVRSMSSEEEELADSFSPSMTTRVMPTNSGGNGQARSGGNGASGGNGHHGGNGNGSGNGNGNGQANAVKPTGQKVSEFYGVKKVGEEVIFSARFERAKKVLIAGDFNNWSPMSTPMIARGRPGEFYMSLPLPRGRYRYRFVVDGKWMTDPHNKYVEVNQFGELNNVIEVE
jgi:chromosome partitioning protein